MAIALVEKERRTEDFVIDKLIESGFRPGTEVPREIAELLKSETQNPSSINHVHSLERAGILSRGPVVGGEIGGYKLRAIHPDQVATALS